MIINFVAICCYYYRIIIIVVVVVIVSVLVFSCGGFPLINREPERKGPGMCIYLLSSRENITFFACLRVCFHLGKQMAKSIRFSSLNSKLFMRGPVYLARCVCMYVCMHVCMYVTKYLCICALIRCVGLSRSKDHVLSASNRSVSTDCSTSLSTYLFI